MCSIKNINLKKKKKNVSGTPVNILDVSGGPGNASDTLNITKMFHQISSADPSQLKS